MINIAKLFKDTYSKLDVIVNKTWSEETYKKFLNEIKIAINEVITQYQDIKHPITLFIDVTVSFNDLGKIYIDHEAAHLILNISNIVFTEDLPFTSSEAFKITNVFVHEMMHYYQFLKKWEFYASRPVNTNFDIKAYYNSPNELHAFGNTIANELIDSYGSSENALNILKQNLGKRTGLIKSKTLQTFIANRNELTKESIKKLFSHIIKQLHKFESLTESPISDIEYHSTNLPPSFSKTDTDYIQDKSNQAIIKKHLFKIPIPISLVFINGDIGGTEREANVFIHNKRDTIDADYIWRKFNIKLKDAKDELIFVININEGDFKKNLTPWIITHRMIHALMINDADMQSEILTMTLLIGVHPLQFKILKIISEHLKVLEKINSLIQENL